MTIVDSSCFCNGEPCDDAPCCENVGFFAYDSNWQIIPTGVLTPLNLTQKEDENPAGIYNLTTDVFTVPTEGRYVLSTNIDIDYSTAGGTLAIEFYKNAAYFCEHVHDPFAGVLKAIGVQIVVWTAKNDTWKVYVFQNSGFNAQIQDFNRESHFSAAAIYIP